MEDASVNVAILIINQSKKRQRKIAAFFYISTLVELIFLLSFSWPVLFFHQQ